jgi:Leucine-rich repeat (LRR) protein
MYLMMKSLELRVDKEFDIEEYLDSLPLDTEKINVSYKKLKYIPDLSRFTNLHTLICIRNKLTFLPPLNESLEYLDCAGNKLTWLPPLNNNLVKLDCSDNKLTWLPPLNYKLFDLNCSYNKLTELPSLNNKLIMLYCDHNKLTMLPPLNNNLITLFCSYNKLIMLPPFNNNLKNLYCSYNKLTILPTLNNNLSIVECNFNNLKYLQPFTNNLNRIYFNKNITINIIIDTCVNDKIKKNIINNKIIILNNFRYTYYALKFKKQFKRWLWEKVREPKIMKQFHPDHLTSLNETDDLEVFLEEWIKKKN